ncbi:TPA: helix-turn-helix domain-containing protein [Stenotrophomonas maltophilia]|uniref:helix-turn-helix transcriptional regulator n=1 Tax=Stenotrophomonas TaxID=40323 RepID=UPI0013DBFE91|nr:MULTISPECIES: helix-turn-helix domain-containing protein [Stenotrophomonas]MBH1605154.1 helix-turn-helix domain-containing protein [Stenotrophomonas maltophilia]MDQ7290241.1 helix-turn-helix domain-containing protein [Stenotrophomonas sp. Sm2128]MDT3471465.1 helix-turn-helix domain-containing protein [Stenotrophomonas maltophilia]HDS1829813.1 helix-turn-helix domain-containing protein [Stenotrophomonas maltophilia]HDX0787794.1 helix-turn-helix domain-containing protein [Stenotrophomonas mal
MSNPQATNPPLDRLSTSAAAERLGLSKSTLDKMRCEGRGPRYLRVGKRCFYRPADLDAYLEAAVVETADSRALPR